MQDPLEVAADPQIEANVPSKLLQGLLESRDARLTFGIICGVVHEYADTTSLFCLLRAHDIRRISHGRGAIEKSDHGNRRLLRT